MAIATIFCPQCASLILDADQCPNCQWQRPAASGDVGKPAWAAALGAKLPSKESHPTADGHNVYFTTETGQIVALDTREAKTEAATTWQHQIDSRSRNHGVAAWNDYVLLGNEFAGGFPTPPGEFIMIQAANGEEFWRSATEGASLSVPVVDGNIAYFTVNSGWLYAIDLEGRRPLWHKKIGGDWSWGPAPALHTPNGRLVLTGRCDKLVAFDLEQGNVAWIFSGGGWFPHTPLWQDGVVYARCWDGYLYAIDGDSGQEIWRYKPPREYSSDPCVTDKYLYAGVKDFQDGADTGSRAYALYVLDRQTGERVGRYEIAGHIFGRPIANDRAVFFATDDKSRVVENQGTIYGLDVLAQETLWEPYIVEQRIQSDILMVNDWLVVGTRQGAVYGIPWQAGDAITETPQLYAAQGAYEKAAAAHALQGEYEQAAELYSRQLNQPMQAGRLYMRAGEYRQVVELFRQSENEAERTLAFEAVTAMPAGDEQAQALADLGEYLGAANVYAQIGEFEKAGDSYLKAQDWEQAQAAYSKAEAWEKWEQVARDRELWQDLVKRFVEVGEYVQAAEIQLNRSRFAEAAANFERAGQAAEALAAYQRLNADEVTAEIQQRMLSLAEETGQNEVAFEIYKAQGQHAKAAELAEALGHYNQAVALYREEGEYRQAAEMLEKLSRFVEAAELFERARRWGKAAENLEKQVEQELVRVGGIRYLQDSDKLENWLNRAIELYEEEADYAGETTRQMLFEGADRCRVSLMRIRREPQLTLNLESDSLVVNQGNAIRYVVENVGWGTARNLSLTISSPNLGEAVDADLGSLGRGEKKEGTTTVVPTLVGEIMLQAELRGQSKSGELYTSEEQNLRVAQVPAAGGQGVSLNTQTGEGVIDLAVLQKQLAEQRGTLWNPGSTHSSTGAAEAPVTPEQLKQKRIDSLRRQLAQHYDNLNKLEEQATVYGAGLAPLQLQNSIDDEQAVIEEIEEELEQLGQE